MGITSLDWKAKYGISVWFVCDFRQGCVVNCLYKVNTYGVECVLPLSCFKTFPF